ncbi:ArsR/SmtB family transcription factor [Kitasatospora sp. NPDC048365]|uniref:ArsR/SmtB family transcription factor n=1 Tax=Kitasatospora sp. NPDC048365 TaxID=3364050 RepID=UPI00371DF37A
MLRIHFTAQDLARVRVAATAGPLAETFAGLQILAEGGSDPLYRPWRARLSGRLDRACRPIWSLLPEPGISRQVLDLAGLAGTDPSAEAGLDSLLGVADRTLRLELGYASLPAADRSWLGELMSGDLTARRQLADSLAAGHRALVAPHWRRMRAHLDAFRADCARTLLEGGVERLLETLCPGVVRWRAPVLEVGGGAPFDVHLAGRGLVITPMVLLAGRPSLLCDLTDEAAPTGLIVPTVRDPLTAAELWGADRAGDERAGADPLAALLGRTRAAALEQVTDGCSTTELARRLNVSPAAASQHTAVLRGAELISTRRRGGAVLHSLTPLGADLLGRARTG